MAEDSAAAELELTILMPCLDETATLAVCIGKARGYLARSGVAGEVVIADNGSTDGSQAIAEAAGARVVAVRGRRTAEVPIVLHPDGRGRPPHLRPWRDGWRHLKFLLMHSPRWLYLYPGLVMAIGGLGGMTLLAALGSIRIFGIQLQVH